MLRMSFEERGKIFVIRVLYRGCVATAPVINRFMDERRNCLRTIGTYGARYPPKYWTLIQCLPYSVDGDARTQHGSLLHLNMVTFIAKLSESCC